MSGSWVYSLTVRGISLDLSDIVGGYAVLRGTLKLDNPGLIAFDLVIVGQDARARTDRENYFNRLLDLIPEAEEHGFSATFGINRSSSSTAYYDVYGATITPTNLYPGSMNVQVFHVELSAYEATRVVAPFEIDITPTLTGSGIMLDIPQVPGDQDALVHLDIADVSATGAIVGFRIAKAPRGFSLVDDLPFTAWQALTSLAGTTAPGGALGGDYLALTTSSLNPTRLGGVTLPDGAIQQGRMDGYALVSALTTRVGNVSAGAITTTVTPAISSGTVPAVRQATIPALLGVHDDAASTSTSGTITLTLSRAGSTNGSTHLFMVRATGQGTPLATIAVAGETPTEIVEAWVDGASSIESYRIKGWIIRNSGNSNNAVITVTISAMPGDDGSAQAAFVEIKNTGPNPILEDLTLVIHGEAQASISLTTGQTADNVVVILGAADLAYDGSPYGTVLGYTGPIAQFPDGAWQQVDGVLQSVSLKVLQTTGFWSAFGVALSVPTTIITPATDSGYVAPTPGVLLVGTYQLHVQAVDAAGAIGNAVVALGLPTTVNIPNSSITWDWPDVTGALAYAVTIDAVVNGETTYYYDQCEGSTYTLKDVTKLGTVDALPPLTGAVAPPAYLEARIGSEGDAVLKRMDEIVIPGSNLQLVRLFGNQTLPPGKPLLDGTYPRGYVEIAVRSPNGLPTVFALHGLFVAPTVEPQGWVRAADGNNVTPWVWRLESHRSGRGILGWLVDSSTGLDAGRVQGMGQLLASPGDNRFFLVPFGRDGEVDLLNSAVTIKATLFPRHRWEAGTLW